MSGRLYVGIDLGTFQSTIASSAGAMHSIETVVGRPKDPVAMNLFTQKDLIEASEKAERRIKREKKLKEKALKASQSQNS